MDRRARAAQLLNNAGFSQAVNLKDGVEGCCNAGLPVRSG